MCGLVSVRGRMTWPNGRAEPDLLWLWPTICMYIVFSDGSSLLTESPLTSRRTGTCNPSGPTVSRPYPAARSCTNGHGQMSRILLQQKSSQRPEQSMQRSMQREYQLSSAGGPRSISHEEWLFSPDSELPLLRDGERACKVSLTMIVRDEEANLPHCLKSVRGVFDEIVVVDTGSVNRTVEIARSFGAQVFDFVWIDDFAAARNAALARATGDYAFWLDADDVLDPPQRDKLQAFLDQLRIGDEGAYMLPCDCQWVQDGNTLNFLVSHVRLFPLRDGISWTYRVHEQLIPALLRANIPIDGII